MKIKCNIHIETLTQITKEQAQDIINCTNENGDMVMNINPPIGGEVKIDYPLKNPDYLYLVAEKTIGGVLWEVAKRYKEIYKGERKTSKELVKNESDGLLNRGTTDGNYGIWGHELEDLWFEGIATENDKIHLYIGS